MAGSIGKMNSGTTDAEYNGTLVDNVQAMVQRWRSVPRGASLVDGLDAFRNLFDVMDLSGATTFSDLQDKLSALTQSVGGMSTDVENHDGLDPLDRLACRRDLRALLNQIYHVNYASLHMYRALCLCAGGAAFADDDKIAERLSALQADSADKEDAKLTAYQALLEYLLNTAAHHRLRKYRGDVYAPVLVGPDDVDSGAWRQVHTMREFINKHVGKFENEAQWRNATAARGNVEAAEKHLIDCVDPRLKELVPDRHVLAFRNGVLHVKWRDATGSAWSYKFFPHDQPKPTDFAASKFFDDDFHDFPECQDWYDIPTPNLQSVMDYQNFSEDVCRWMYVTFGRLLYNVGELDGWQVIPFLKGLAGSGKSTLVKVCKQFYNPEDVGVLSNNAERQFGLSAFFDKLLFIAPEIKNDLKVEQAEFQSMISGEDVQIAIKHKKARSVVWKTPGVLAGNEVPAWADNSGSIQRRILLFEFARKVEAGDMELDKKLERELCAIIAKCVRAYLDAAAKWGWSNIWTVVPEYFKEQRNQLAEGTNPLENFLASDRVRFGGELSVELHAFKAAFYSHCLSNQLRKPTWVKDLYLGPFQKYGITHGSTLTGVELVEDSEPADPMF